MSAWHLICRVLRANISLYFSLCLTSLIIAITAISVPWLLKDAIDLTIFQKNFSSFQGTALEVIGLLLICYFSYLCYMRFEFQIVQKGVYQLRQFLYTKLVYQPLHYFHNTRTGELLQRILQDTSIFETYISSILNDLPYDVLLILSVFTLMFITNSILTTYFFVFFSISIFLSFYASKPLTSITHKTQIINTVLSGRLHEILAGIRTVKNCNREQDEISSLDNLSTEILSWRSRTNWIDSFLVPFFEFITLWETVLIILLGIYLISKNHLAPSDLILFILYIEILSPPASRIYYYYEHWRQLKGVSLRLEEFLASLNKMPTSFFKGTQPLEDLFPIIFNRIGFHYPESQKNVLSNINFEIKQNEIIGITGLNGAGKSTLTDILLGLQPPSEGEILIGKTPLFELKEEAWRNQIGILPQNIYLFNDTIANNIAYSKPKATRKEIIAAAEAAGLSNLLAKLPGGINTMVGEKGGRLSGGEKQKIALARLLLKKPRLLIFDEATSHLDSSAIADFLSMLKHLTQECTVLMIEHHLELIKKLKKIILLDNGQIIAIGTYTELMKNFSHFLPK